MQTRSLLTNLLRYLGWFAAAAVLFVLLDFMIDLRPPEVHQSYRFRVPELVDDKPVILRQDNLSILVIRRSEKTITRLQKKIPGLQDPESRRSHQPDYARNPLRSKTPEHFVAYALGTHLGCPLAIDSDSVGETCSSARYDFAGRALAGEHRFQNLEIPDYTFADDLTILTIRP